MNAGSVVGLPRKLRATRRWRVRTGQLSGGCKQTGYAKWLLWLQSMNFFGSLCKWRRTARASRCIYSQSFSFPNGWPATVVALLCMSPSSFLCFCVSVFLYVRAYSVRPGTDTGHATPLHSGGWWLGPPRSKVLVLVLSSLNGRINKAANSIAINLVVECAKCVKCARSSRLIVEVGEK